MTSSPLSTIASLRLTARFVRRVPRMLRSPTSAPEAHRLREARFATRDSAFLDKLDRAVYRRADSPYARLLSHAGCELGDVERLVADEGLERALCELARTGVYLTVEEFKGRRPVKRGSLSFDCGSAAVRNPLSGFHLAVRSGGTRSAGTPVLMDLEFVRGCGTVTAAFLEAWGDDGWRKALWETPGAGARFRLLKYASFGAAPERWFSQLDPAAPQLDPMLRWSERATRWGARLGAVALPRPEHVSLEDPGPIARWMASVIRDGARPYLFTFASSAVRLSRAAVEAGIDLEGARILLGGEPITSARLEAIRASGATALPRYGSVETGPVGYGCLAPNGPDDVHLLADLQAVIHPPDEVQAAAGLPTDALLLTALYPSAPFVMLNTSMGDEGEIVRRTCGCGLESLGYLDHIASIRSFEKLTSEGATLLDGDVVRLLETVLPEEIGGTPTDYQLVEQEDSSGRTRLRLLVHPRVGELDAIQVKEAFLRGLEASGGRAIGLLWRDADLLSVERTPPLPTQAGKIQHLHRAPTPSA